MGRPATQRRLPMGVEARPARYDSCALFPLRHGGDRARPAWWSMTLADLVHEFFENLLDGLEQTDGSQAEVFLVRPDDTPVEDAELWLVPPSYGHSQAGSVSSPTPTGT
jgi:hypothetical protein